MTAKDISASKFTVRGKSGDTAIPYAKIAGKGTEFSVPFLGTYENWLTAGQGLLYSVIAMGAVFVIFAVSAFCVRDKE